MAVNPAPRESWITVVFIATVMIVAIVLRCGVLWKYQSQLADDPDHYRRIARQLASGNGFLDPDTGQPTAYRPPLYPLMLSAILRCGGQDVAIGSVQALLGVLTVALAMDMGRRLGLGKASCVAGLLVALDPLLLYQTTQVMTEGTAAFLAALCLWLCLIPTAPYKSLLIGVVFGLACLCRPTFWAFGIIAGLYWSVSNFRSIEWQDGYSDGAIRPAVFGLVGVLIVVGPWGMRNYQALGRPVITTTHGGYTLLLGHNPAYTRDVVQQPWGTVWRSETFDEWSAEVEAELSALKPPLDRAHLTPAVELARDEWMNRQAWDYIHRQPRTAVQSGLTLLGRMWSVIPAATTAVIRSQNLRLAVGAFYAPLLAAMLVGLIRVARHDWHAWWPLVCMIVGLTAVHSLYWADMRMRAPLAPAIALLATASCVRSQRRDDD